MNNKLTIEVDPALNLAYLSFNKKASVQRTEEFNKSVLIDLDDLGVVVGIELLNCSADVSASELTRLYHVPSVAGSSPARPTTFTRYSPRKHWRVAGFSFLLQSRKNPPGQHWVNIARQGLRV